MNKSRYENENTNDEDENESPVCTHGWKHKSNKPPSSNNALTPTPNQISSFPRGRQSPL
jgi:hypothetical protein